jgi:hypothetical protein
LTTTAVIGVARKAGLLAFTSMIISFASW